MWRIVREFQTNGTVHNRKKDLVDGEMSELQKALMLSVALAFKVQKFFSAAISKVGLELNKQCPYFDVGFETLSVSHSD